MSGQGVGRGERGRQRSQEEPREHPSEAGRTGGVARAQAVPTPHACSGGPWTNLRQVVAVGGGQGQEVDAGALHPRLLQQPPEAARARPCCVCVFVCLFVGECGARAQAGAERVRHQVAARGCGALSPTPAHARCLSHTHTAHTRPPLPRTQTPCSSGQDGCAARPAGCAPTRAVPAGRGQRGIRGSAQAMRRCRGMRHARWVARRSTVQRSLRSAPHSATQCSAPRESPWPGH